jgi:hypothetical protein
VTWLLLSEARARGCGGGAPAVFRHQAVLWLAVAQPVALPRPPPAIGRPRPGSLSGGPGPFPAGCAAARLRPARAGLKE